MGPGQSLCVCGEVICSPPVLLEGLGLVRRMILKILLTHIGPGTMVVPSFLSIICISANQAPSVYLFTQPVFMEHHSE